MHHFLGVLLVLFLLMVGIYWGYTSYERQVNNTADYQGERLRTYDVSITEAQFLESEARLGRLQVAYPSTSAGYDTFLSDLTQAGLLEAQEARQLIHENDQREPSLQLVPLPTTVLGADGQYHRILQIRSPQITKTLDAGEQN